MKTEGNLMDFQWDDIDPIEVDENEESTKQKVNKDEEEEKKKEEPKEEVVEEPFKEDEEEGKNDEDKDFYKNLFTGLKEKGIFSHIDIKDDEEIDEEKFVELQDAEIDKRVEEALEGFINDLDDEAKLFLEFKKKGGETKEFFEVLKEEVSLPEGNIEDESYQEKITKYYYSKYDDMTSDDIDDRIEWLKDHGKLEEYAKKYESKIQDKIAKEKERIKSIEDKKKENLEKFRTNLKEKLEKTNEIKDIPITKKDKTELLDYIIKPKVNIGGGKFLTKFQADLRDVINDNDKMILLAKILNNDFNFDDLKKKITTKTAISLREKLSSQSATKVKTGSSQGKALIDYF